MLPFIPEISDIKGKALSLLIVSNGVIIEKVCL